MEFGALEIEGSSESGETPETGSGDRDAGFRYIARRGNENIALFKSRKDMEFFVWVSVLQSYLQEPPNQATMHVIQRLIEGITKE